MPTKLLIIQAYPVKICKLSLTLCFFFFLNCNILMIQCHVGFWYNTAIRHFPLIAWCSSRQVPAFLSFPFLCPPPTSPLVTSRVISVVQSLFCEPTFWFNSISLMKDVACFHSLLFLFKTQVIQPHTIFDMFFIIDGIRSCCFSTSPFDSNWGSGRIKLPRAKIPWEHFQSLLAGMTKWPRAWTEGTHGGWWSSSQELGSESMLLSSIKVSITA